METAYEFLSRLYLVIRVSTERVVELRKTKVDGILYTGRFPGLFLSGMKSSEDFYTRMEIFIPRGRNNLTDRKEKKKYIDKTDRFFARRIRYYLSISVQINEFIDHRPIIVHCSSSSPTLISYSCSNSIDRLIVSLILEIRRRCLFN